MESSQSLGSVVDEKIGVTASKQSGMSIVGDKEVTLN